MNQHKQTIRKNISEILKYLRFVNGIPQAIMAKKLNLTRTTYIRLETGIKDLTYSEWFVLEKEFGVAHKDLEIGQLHFPKDNTEVFRIPSKYADNMYSKGRLVTLLIQFFKFSLGELAFSEFCEREKINPLYFVNVSNPISISFTIRLYQELIIRGVLSNDNQLKEFARMGVSSKSHHGDNLSSYFEITGLEKLKILLENINYLEENHLYKIENIAKDFSELTFSFSPKSHIELSKYRHDPILGDFLNRWSGIYMSTFAGENIDIKCIDNFHKGAQKNTFQLIAS